MYFVSLKELAVSLQQSFVEVWALIAQIQEYFVKHALTTRGSS